MRGLDKLGGLALLLVVCYVVVQFLSVERVKRLPGFDEAHAPQAVGVSFERAFPNAKIDAVTELSPTTVPNPQKRFRVTFLAHDKVERQAVINGEGEIISVTELTANGKNSLAAPSNNSPPKGKTPGAAPWGD